MGSDWVRKFWPIIVFLLGAAAAMGTTFYRVGAAEEMNANQEATHIHMWATIGELRAAQSATTEALGSIKAQQQEMRGDIKEILRAVDGRAVGHKHTDMETH